MAPFRVRRTLSIPCPKTTPGTPHEAELGLRTLGQQRRLSLYSWQATELAGAHALGGTPGQLGAALGPRPPDPPSSDRCALFLRKAGRAVPCLGRISVNENISFEKTF